MTFPKYIGMLAYCRKRFNPELLHRNCSFSYHSAGYRTYSDNNSTIVYMQGMAPPELSSPLSDTLRWLSVDFNSY